MTDQCIIGNGGRDGGGGDVDPSGGGGLETAALGDHGYSNLREDFTATVSSATEITLASLATGLTVDADRIVAIGTRPATGEVDWNWIYQRGSGYMRVSYAGGVITVDSGITLTVGENVAVWVEGPPRFQGDNIDGTYHLKTRNEAFTVATRSERVEEIDPIDNKYLPDTVADVTNGADATYDYYLDLATFRRGSLQLILDGGSGTVTVKLYGTIQDDGTAAASCVYEDIGLAEFGAASWTADAIINDSAEALAGYKYLKIEVVAATGGADDADWTIYAKRLY